MNDRRVTMKEIQRATCEQFKVNRVDMLAHCKLPHLVEPRHIAMYLSRKIAGRTWRQIGLAFGRHHASVMDACRGVESRLSEGRGDTAERVAAVEAAMEARSRPDGLKGGGALPARQIIHRSADI